MLERFAKLVLFLEDQLQEMELQNEQGGEALLTAQNILIERINVSLDWRYDHAEALREYGVDAEIVEEYTNLVPPPSHD